MQALIKEGNFAIIGKIVDTSFFPDDYVTNDDLKVYLMKYRVSLKINIQFNYITELQNDEALSGTLLRCVCCSTVAFNPHK